MTWTKPGIAAADWSAASSDAETWSGATSAAAETWDAATRTRRGLTIEEFAVLQTLVDSDAAALVDAEYADDWPLATSAAETWAAA